MNLPDLYLESPLAKKLAFQKKLSPSSKPICLFSDLDDSYLMKYWPSEDTLQKLSQKHTDTILSPDKEIYATSSVLKKYLDEKGIPLIIVTGRDLYQMEELRKNFDTELPDSPDILKFDGIIGAVGTEIYINTKNNSYEQDLSYMQLVQNTVFDRTHLHRILSDLIPIIREKYNPVAFDFSKRDQTESVDELPKQPHKLSIEFKSDSASSKEIVKTIQNDFNSHGFGDMKIILSSPYSLNDEVHKYNLDIVPFSKDVPINYLKNLLDVTGFVAGDSGNDFDMLAKAADIGIVVGNAKRELKEQIELLPQAHQSHIYTAPAQYEGPKGILYVLQNMATL